MAAWDEHDAKTSEAVAALLNETVIWRPQVPPADPYATPSGGNPDPNRPIRQLEAVVSWQPTGLPVAPGAPSIVAEASVLLDFELDLFRNEWAAYGQPKKGDRFECPEQDHADQLIKVERVGDDGSARIYAWCSVVTEA